VAAALSVCREGSHNLLQDARDRLTEAARGLKAGKEPAAASHSHSTGHAA